MSELRRSYFRRGHERYIAAALPHLDIEIIDGIARSLPRCISRV
jgi:hypothetical protein